MPLVLLTIVGVLLGSTVALSKVAIAGGVPPLAYAFWQAIGGGLILTAVSMAARRKVTLTRHYLRYSLIAGVLTVALPNALLFFVVPHLGASLAGTMYALPPLAPVAFWVLLGKERLSPLALLGIVIGLTGTLLMIWSSPNARSPESAVSVWMLLALAIPLTLALGNVYRSLDWPQDLLAEPLAAGMLLAAAALLFPAMLFSGSGYAPLGLATPVDKVVIAQSFVTAIAFIAYFRLQRIAGPVYLSQIGYVMTLTGVVAGTLFLGEELAGLAWLAVGVILAGVALFSTARSRAPAT